MKELKCPFCSTILTFEMQDVGVCFNCGERTDEFEKIQYRKKLEEQKKLKEAQKEQERKRQEIILNFKITTGFNFEGYRIENYLGIVHGECVMGTGFFNDLSASFNDLLGTNSEMVSNKLLYAKEKALKDMINSGINKGANALIGIDFDVSTIYSNMLLVSANATAVFITKKEIID